MKRSIFLLIIIFIGLTSRSQRVDSLFFNLYTDSLKKGVYNYINVDGKLSNGQWLPLTGKELIFSSSEGKFDCNSLIIDTSSTAEKVTIKVVLKNNTTVSKEITVYIKKVHSTERLKTIDEILGNPSRKNKPIKKGTPVI